MVRKRYFNWMHDIACGGVLNYRKLLSCLDDVPFTYIIPMDANRYEDGIDLRYRFAYENDISEPAVASELDNKECSVLEMMVSLAIRCEELMANPDYDSRTSEWFMWMIQSLGLEYATDQYYYYSENLIKKKIDILLNREYKPNGRGGLFTLKEPPCDLRGVEIWTQMMWWINEYLMNE